MRDEKGVSALFQGSEFLWRNGMPDNGCATCVLRAKYDANPKSLLGWLWRWHAGWCPGFKGYLFSLREDERRTLIQKYRITKYAGKSDF